MTEEDLCLLNKIADDEMKLISAVIEKIEEGFLINKTMKTYIGKKQVKAETMNELAAVENGFARKNEDNHEWREGYHVQYTNPDGSTYDSWSPKSVFEQAYKCADSFIDRLQIEFSEMAEHLDSLDEFLSRGFDHVAEKVGYKQAAMLISQRTAMQIYFNILDTRIDDLKQSNNAPTQTQG